MKGTSQVAVIGAGYAGMAAAAELAARGVPVTVFEASRVLGGRARAVSVGSGGNTTAVDNGQHLLIGAYSETLRLMRLVGADPEQLLLSTPLTLVYPGELALQAPALPAPLHLAAALLCARGLGLSDKLAAFQFMRRLKKSRFRLQMDTTVTALLDAHDQPPRLREFLWEPLCVAALNTPADAASAKVFLNVLKDTLGGKRHASDLLLPRVDLTALFPEPASRFVQNHGGRVLRGEAIRNIEYIEAGGGSFHLRSASRELGRYAQLIIAVAPYHLTALIGGLATELITELPGLDELCRQVEALAWEPIVTCYLAYPPPTRLTRPMLGHAGGLMQWLIDRGQLGGPPGLFAAVISARGRHRELSNDELAAKIHTEIAGFMPKLPAPLWSRVITEKRATFSCVPGLARPETQTALPGLFLAGDYVASDYPATLESAVRSGVNAAKLAAKSI